MPRRRNFYVEKTPAALHPGRLRLGPEQKDGNAIVAANTPNLDKLFAACPYTTIGASGMDVGLPDGQMGNSEVGHTNIGAGRIVYQELTRITKAIEDGDFFDNEALLRLPWTTAARTAAPCT